MAHGPGPRPGHPARRDIAIGDDLQGRNQLAFKERAAPPVIGERRKRRHHGHIAAPCAVKAFQPPDGGHHMGLNPIARLDPRQDGPILAQLVLAHGHAFGLGGDGEVIFQCAGELGLVAVTLHHIGQKAGRSHRVTDHPGRDATRGGAGAKPRDPSVKPGIGHRAHHGFGLCGANRPAPTPTNAGRQPRRDQPHHRYPPRHCPHHSPHTRGLSSDPIAEPKQFESNLVSSWPKYSNPPIGPGATAQAERRA